MQNVFLNGEHQCTSLSVMLRVHGAEVGVMSVFVGFEESVLG